MNQNSSKIWRYIGGAVIVAVIALAVWHWNLFPTQTPATTSTLTTTSTPISAIQQSQLSPLASGNTTADIQNDLNQTSNGSAALNQDQNSVNASIQGL